MKIEDFEMIYLYKIYEQEFNNNDSNSNQFINFFEQLTKFLVDNISFSKVTEQQSRSIIDGIFEYFEGNDLDFLSSLTQELQFGINSFLFLFSKCGNTGNGVDEYLNSNNELKIELKKIFSYLKDVEDELEY
ncbi:MAG: hypothetical protein LCH34_14285 [Firmicutes bacterium]|nr:hypothetical protein [Bacillota bacterium]